MNAYFIYKTTCIKPHLYAIANKKEYCDRFMKERNNDMFTFIEKYVTKDDYNEFLSHHSEYELGLRQFKTKDKEIDNETVALVLATSREEMETYVKMDMVLSELSQWCYPITSSFNQELLDSLGDLGFIVMYNFRLKRLLIDRNPFFSPDRLGISPEDHIQLQKFPFKIDELAVFLKLFGYTFKKD